MSDLSKSIIEECMLEAYHQIKDNNEGNNADYIPYLANIPRELFSIAISLPDGDVLSIGDSDYKFGIESISKVSTAILVMNQSTPDQLMKKIGADATGLPFNSISALVGGESRSNSPLVNAGAISCCSMVLPFGDFDQKWEKILKMAESLCGQPLKLIDELYNSEGETNFHNRAIAWILKSNSNIFDDTEKTLDLYTRQCSLAIDTKALAVIGGTIANGGINPITLKRVFREEVSSKIVALMAIQGFYETSGDWLYNSGIPAKTGVGGGIVGIMPKKFGIAAFSPPLDKSGNSIKAQLAIKHIVKKLRLNIFGNV